MIFLTIITTFKRTIEQSNREYFTIEFRYYLELDDQEYTER